MPEPLVEPAAQQARRTRLRLRSQRGRRVGHGVQDGSEGEFKAAAHRRDGERGVILEMGF